MRPVVFASLLIVMAATGLPVSLLTQHKHQPRNETGYKWNQLTASASFEKSYNFQLFAIHDTILAMHHDGAWTSLDGKTWTPSGLVNIINNNAFLDYVWFRNALYGIGSFKGNIERYEFHPAIYRSTDMKNWETLTTESDLPKRFFYHPFVFNDKLWIIGGSDGKTTYSDIWNSTDGIHWTKQADHLPFGERENSQFLVFKNKLFMLNNDVWSSTDGLNWVEETAAIVKDEAIFGYAPVVFDDRIWLLGCNRNGRFKSELLVSTDGKNWTAQRAPWSPRGGIGACIFKDKIVMTGGKYGGPEIQGQTEFVYSNDVWSLEK